MEVSRIGGVVSGKYRLDEELGRGGMGAVYRAFHLRVHKEFALKMLLGRHDERHRSIASRFQLEAQAAGRIGHPGILDVYDVGEDADGTPFIVMELLRGEPLSALVRRGRIEVDAALWIAMEVLDVLTAAHKAGIIHRDIKPQNVFLTETPAGTRGVKLLDFGIAKFAAGVEGSALTRSGEIIGSPLYMAPEQAKGELDVDERVDVWSVGAMLFEMLTGQCAHAATTPVAVLAKILTEPARPPGINAEVDAAVERALTIDRAARWPSAKDMRDALAKLRTTEGIPMLPASVKPSTPPLSADRTPGAITSTIAMPSTPPPSGFGATEAAQVYAAQSDERQVDTARTRAETPAAKASPTRWLAALGAVAIGAVFYAAARPPAPTVNTQTGVTPPISVALPSASTPTPVASVSATPVASLPAAATVSATPAATSAGTPTSASAPLPPAGPRCTQREHLSQGHCCDRGLEWQNGHCERPIATTF